MFHRPPAKSFAAFRVLPFPEPDDQKMFHEIERKGRTHQADRRTRKALPVKVPLPLKVCTRLTSTGKNLILFEHSGSEEFTAIVR